MNWAGHVAHSVMGSECTVLAGKLEGKWLHWRPICRWEDNIKVDSKEQNNENVY